jgi:hypothetical protein
MLSIDELEWTVTWCCAFPTLLADDCFCDYKTDSAFLAAPLRSLAWRSLFPDDTIASTTTNHHDQTTTTTTTTTTTVENCWSESLGYGEIVPETVFKVIEWIQTHCNDNNLTTIFDLGSGDGKVLLATALCVSHACLVGIEIVPALHEQAIQRYQRWNETCSNSSNTVEFFCCDFTMNKPWITRTANLIWIHGTVFGDDLFAVVANDICYACQPGTIFVMISRPLPNTDVVETLFEQMLSMSWGVGMVYVQRRK